MKVGEYTSAAEAAKVEIISEMLHKSPSVVAGAKIVGSVNLAIGVNASYYFYNTEIGQSPIVDLNVNSTATNSVTDCLIDLIGHFTLTANDIIM